MRKDLPGAAPEYLFVMSSATSDEAEPSSGNDWIVDPSDAALLAISLIPGLGVGTRVVLAGAYFFSDWLVPGPSSKKVKSDANEYVRDLNSRGLLEFEGLASARAKYEFQPGHPRRGEIYRLHPLLNQRPCYLPLDSFDDLLVRERKAEFLAFLVELGATEVVIEENHKSDRTASASAGVDAPLVEGEAKMEWRANRESMSSQLFRLSPRPGRSIGDVDLAKFHWFKFEPEWSSLHHARLQGGCTHATVELTISGSYGGGAMFGLRVPFGAADGSLALESSTVRSYTYRVEFDPVDWKTTIS